MLRSLLLALVMVSALLVLLAGASGGLRSLPNPSAMLAAMVTTVTANPAGPSRGDSSIDRSCPKRVRSASAPDLAGGQQARGHPRLSRALAPSNARSATCKLSSKSAHRSLTQLRASQEQVRRDVGSLLQQRQAAMQAPPSPSHHKPRPHRRPVGLSPKDAESRRYCTGTAAQEAGPTQQRSTEASSHVCDRSSGRRARHRQSQHRRRCRTFSLPQAQLRRRRRHWLRHRPTQHSLRRCHRQRRT